MEWNINIVEELGSEIKALENQVKYLRSCELSDNAIIWKLQLENNLMREVLKKYATHNTDCGNVDFNAHDCYCGFIGALRYLGMM